MSVHVPRAAAREWTALQEALREAGQSVPCRALGVPDEWFEPGSAEAASACCRPCPVITECRKYAVAAGERSGVWGGRWRGRLEETAA